MVDSNSALGVLVAEAIRELDAYTGSAKSRYHYNAFRNAKRQIYALRPDLAKPLLTYIVAHTHWDDRQRERREHEAERAATERLYAEQEARRQRARAQSDFLRYEVTRSTVNRWLRDGIGAKSWANIVEALKPSLSTLKRWERNGIPEDKLRTLEKGARREESLRESDGYDEPIDFDELDSDYLDTDDYEPDDIDWDEIAETWDGYVTDFAMFEKLS